MEAPPEFQLDLGLTRANSSRSMLNDQWNGIGIPQLFREQQKCAFLRSRDGRPESSPGAKMPGHGSIRYRSGVSCGASSGLENLGLGSGDSEQIVGNRLEVQGIIGIGLAYRNA